MTFLRYLMQLVRGLCDFSSNSYKKRNEWSVAQTGHCLKGLGIVAKEQGSAGYCESQTKSNLQLMFW